MAGLMVSTDEINGWIYDIEPMSVESAIGYHSNLWRTAKHNLPTLTDEQLAVVVSLVVGTCPHCHDNELDCYCSRDD
jgi:hypothetical protein